MKPLTYIITNTAFVGALVGVFLTNDPLLRGFITGFCITFAILGAATAWATQYAYNILVSKSVDNSNISLLTSCAKVLLVPAKAVQKKSRAFFIFDTVYDVFVLVGLAALQLWPALIGYAVMVGSQSYMNAMGRFLLKHTTIIEIDKGKERVE